MPVFTGDQLEIRIDPELSEFEHLHIIVTHDESTFDSNDGRREGWHPRNEQPLKKKSHGRSIHVSEFLTETIGRLKLSNEQIEAFGNSIPHEACVIMYPGKNQDGWWNLQQLIAQVCLQRVRLLYHNTTTELLTISGDGACYTYLRKDTSWLDSRICIR